MASLVSEKSRSRLEKLFGERFSQLDQNKVLVLATADSEGEVNHSRIRETCNLHSTDITNLLQWLVEQGFLEREGRRRGSRYRLPGMDSVADNSDKTLDNPELLEIASEARQHKRLTQQDMERIILKLCTNRWLTRQQIAILMERNAEYLRQHYLNLMVECRLLRLRFNSKPGRKLQAYTAAEQTEIL